MELWPLQYLLCVQHQRNFAVYDEGKFRYDSVYSEGYSWVSYIDRQR